MYYFIYSKLFLVNDRRSMMIFPRISSFGCVLITQNITYFLGYLSSISSHYRYSNWLYKLMIYVLYDCCVYARYCAPSLWIIYLLLGFPAFSSSIIALPFLGTCSTFVNWKLHAKSNIRLAKNQPECYLPWGNVPL